MPVPERLALEDGAQHNSNKPGSVGGVGDDDGIVEPWRRHVGRKDAGEEKQGGCLGHGEMYVVDEVDGEKHAQNLDDVLGRHDPNVLSGSQVEHDQAHDELHQHEYLMTSKSRVSKRHATARAKSKTYRGY